MRLLTDVYTPDAPVWLHELPAVQVLRRAWVQQYVVDAEDGVPRRDPKACPPGALRLVSPYDAEARASVKRDFKWDGFKVHHPDRPHPERQIGPDRRPLQPVRFHRGLGRQDGDLPKRQDLSPVA
ncbi:hypothetical protein ACIQWV_17645 [Streptomyces sp. NPDC098085]|uniref:hypothetical protein n=1 Tax=Streptomyces sp. NPDC098085 TaxID=3366094 RepID=UPI00382FD015